MIIIPNISICSPGRGRGLPGPGLWPTRWAGLFPPWTGATPRSHGTVRFPRRVSQVRIHFQNSEIRKKNTQTCWRGLQGCARAP